MQRLEVSGARVETKRQEAEKHMMPSRFGLLRPVRSPNSKSLDSSLASPGNSEAARSKPLKPMNPPWQVVDKDAFPSNEFSDIGHFEP